MNELRAGFRRSARNVGRADDIHRCYFRKRAQSVCFCPSEVDHDISSTNELVYFLSLANLADDYSHSAAGKRWLGFRASHHCNNFVSVLEQSIEKVSANKSRCARDRKLHIISRNTFRIRST